MTMLSRFRGCAGTCRRVGRPLARLRAACYTASVPYIEPEEYPPEPPLRTHDTGPLAWEDPSLSFFRRFFSTLAATFAPLRTIHAVAAGELGPALRFALLTAFPLMLLWAIVPFTHTLLFVPPFGIKLVTDKATMPVWLDVARAAGIGFGFSAITFLSWTLPFASLVSAFANGSRPENPKLAAWRTALYRDWVIPLGMTLLSLTEWAVPTPSAVAVEITILSVQMLPRILILVHCHTMARYFGANGFGALVVSVIPLAVQWAVNLSLQQVIVSLLPAMPPT
jgi:hypothetical protein